MTTTEIGLSGHREPSSRMHDRIGNLAALLGIDSAQVSIAADGNHPDAAMTASVREVSLHQVLGFVGRQACDEDVTLSIRGGEFHAAATGLTVRSDTDGCAEIVIAPGRMHIPPTAR